jgi:ubiquinol-cytochrome c reductase cytochrome c1 subunit
MEIHAKRRIRNVIAGVAAGAVLLTASGAWASGGPEIERQKWTFGGLFGYYDKDQLKRGYQVYKDVCSACHGLKRVSFRNLGEPGGPGFTKEEVEKIAAEAEIPADPNDEGKTYNAKGDRITRPGKPSDRFPMRYANDKEAAAAQNGAIPPDLSLITKARGASRNVAWFMEPAYWAYDIGTMYQEQGADYVYSLMINFDKMPETKEACEHHGEPHKWDDAANKGTFKLADGMNYNASFPGYQLAMPAPMGTLETPKAGATKEEIEKVEKANEEIRGKAKDVAAFLAWTAEPKLEARKRLGIKVLFYLFLLSGLLYLSKRALWRNVKH